MTSCIVCNDALPFRLVTHSKSTVGQCSIQHCSGQRYVVIRGTTVDADLLGLQQMSWCESITRPWSAPTKSWMHDASTHRPSHCSPLVAVLMLQRQDNFISFVAYVHFVHTSMSLWRRPRRPATGTPAWSDMHGWRLFKKLRAIN